uniref:Thioredoxin domain-containing protein n=1 Tax=Haptolina ericina TaxID=156174 RepID=A0A7S3ATB5_9EUKA|mmetsp:Transcript_34487/g.78174  ORF Transcript_34487/g.78174 Transcript_34487/m.78174 type:complete len:191 (+) Transcript_34487:35-607(+)
MLSHAILLALVGSAHANAVELTKSNFKELVTDSGKGAFVKFLAPWCGHCKSMKPAWDQLGSEYASSSSVVIGDADCTASGKDLCEEYEVRGYPTIKYFNAETGPKGTDYSGGRSFDDLKKFVSESLEIKCLKDDTSGCSEKEVEFLNKWKDKEAADIKAQLDRLSKMSAGSMKPDLKKWLVQRQNILKQL